MDRENKLKLVFDFIANYLSEEESITKEEDSEYTVTENEEVNDNMKRAYTIMKKMDELDKQDALTNRVVKEATKPFKEALKEERKKNEEKLCDTFKSRIGVTLDDKGKISEVEVGNLRDYVPISEVMENIGPSLNDIKDMDKTKTIAKGKKLETVLKGAKNIIDKK